MLTAEEILAYCLKKPGAVLTQPFGEIPLCLKVGGRIYAELYPHAEDYKITLKCEPLRADVYRREYPGVVVRGYHCPPVQQPHRNTVWIAHMEEEMLWHMIDHSYEQVLRTMPKKAREAVLAAVPGEAEQTPGP